VLELFQFQRAAASQIADRFVGYNENPATIGRRNDQREVPFYQALSSITGSGKTAILAQTVGEIAEMLDPAPVVLWLSKGKVVVAQSYANLSDGGKYNHLLGKSTVRLLGEYRPEDVGGATETSVYFATVGTFNQRDRESSTLRVYRSEVDTTETSTWEALKNRRAEDGILRPLVIVYDEAQNLSDQQTELLLELEPAAFLLASATLRFPARFTTEVIDPLRQNAGLSDADLITSISSSVVVESGLVKSTILLDGLNSPMQETIATMLADMKEAEQDAADEGLPLSPKAIYVSNTNVVDGDDGMADDPRQPFEQRQAPPILIWRYLVEESGISASDVAVYADLKTHKDFPLPVEFNLFSGGETDYERFTESNYRHIIFNLALQEGWDDPEAYFAYIDKSMNSRVQVTQIVGRVLRQPGATHYAAPRLNTAHFYVRLDRNSVFTDVVEDVKKGLGGDAPEVRFIATAPGRERPIQLPVKEVRHIPKVALLSGNAKPAVEAVIAKLNDYSDDVVNTRAVGSRRTVTQEIGGDAVDSDWVDFAQTSRVSVRWVFRREVSRNYRLALTVVNSDGPKFDARVGVGSPAFSHVVDIAGETVEKFLDAAQIKQQRPNPYEVGGILARPSEVESFTNALHDGYDGLNLLEKPFAQALDALGLPWCRNPSQVGYKIPLLSPGATVNFFPDFLLWSGDSIFCLDTKGEQLIESDAGRKLLSIVPAKGDTTTVAVKLISKGRWNADRTRTSPDGFTLWGVRHDGRLITNNFDEIPEILAEIIAEAEEDAQED
jgi:type III restriction enzyme